MSRMKLFHSDLVLFQHKKWDRNDSKVRLALGLDCF